MTASIGTMCGLGCLAGPPLGGILYELPHRLGSKRLIDQLHVDAMCFRAPSFFFAGITGALATYAYFTFGNAQPEEEVSKGNPVPIMSILTSSRTMSLVAIALSGTVVVRACLVPLLNRCICLDGLEKTDQWGAPQDAIQRTCCKATPSVVCGESIFCG